MYNQRYNHFYSTDQAFQSFVYKRSNTSEKLNFLFILNLDLKEQYKFFFIKFVRSTCLHFQVDSLSQTFNRTGIHLSYSVMQSYKNVSYMLKTIIKCSLQNINVPFADMHLSCEP